MQSHFNFTAPHQGSTSLSRHTSWLGAKSAEERIGRQALLLLTLYKQQGPLTDSEAAEALNLQRSTINARRAHLIELGFVVAVGTRKNAQSGIRNTTWGIATNGR